MLICELDGTVEEVADQIDEVNAVLTLRRHGSQYPGGQNACVFGQGGKRLSPLLVEFHQTTTV